MLLLNNQLEGHAVRGHTLTVHTTNSQIKKQLRYREGHSYRKERDCIKKRHCSLVEGRGV